jgi:uracil-DNA glycosylase
MNIEPPNKIFDILSDDWKNILVNDIEVELINILNTISKIEPNTLCPKADLIFNFAKFHSPSDTKIVLLGQDPYIGEDEAMGLSFSCNKKIPPSLQNIYKNLVIKGLINKMPTTGDLTSWARQGILLLNTSLTTIRGKSNAHKELWSKYTNHVIRKISERGNIIFILLGNDAKQKRNLIVSAPGATPNKIFTWGHPSPLNSVNRTECPSNFKYCDVFELSHNELLKRGVTINWMPVQALPETPITAPITTPDRPQNEFKLPDNELFKLNVNSISVGIISEKLPKAPTDDIYIFTDGGCTGNGKTHAKASWAFYMVYKQSFYCMCDRVAEVDLGGKFKTSNQRGELLAISKAVQFIDLINTKSAEERLIDVKNDLPVDVKSIRHNYIITLPSGGITPIDFRTHKVYIYTDSKYSIGCYTLWAPKWRNSGEQKKNMDIIMPTLDIIDKINSYTELKFTHIRSHTKVIPADPVERFHYYGNDIADKLCSSILKK